MSGGGDPPGKSGDSLPNSQDWRVALAAPNPLKTEVAQTASRAARPARCRRSPLVVFLPRAAGRPSPLARLQKVWQLGDIERDPPRLVPRQGLPVCPDD